MGGTVIHEVILFQFHWTEWGGAVTGQLLLEGTEITG